MLKDIVGEAQAAVIAEEVGVFIEQLKLIGWKDIQSWSEFLPLRNMYQSPPPMTYKAIEERIVANILYYRMNYLIIICGIFLLRIIFSPVIFLALILCTTFSYVMIILVKGTIIVGDIEINQTNKIIICSIISFLILGLCGALEHVLWGVVISFSLCLLHMIFRPRNLSSAGNKAYEEFRFSASQWFSSRKSPLMSKNSSGGDEEGDDVESTSGGSTTDYNSDPMSYHNSGGITSSSMRKRTGK